MYIKRCAAVLALVAILCCCLTACGTQIGQAAGESAWTDDDPFALLFHQRYLDFTGIEVHHQSDRSTIGKKIRKALGTEPVHMNLEGGGLFEQEYYALTRNSGEYLYYGSVQNNRPDGFGVLTVDEVDPDSIETLCALVYAGNFKTGRYDGYGAQFALQYKDLENSSDLEQLTQCVQAGILPNDEDSLMLAMLYLSSYVTADGDWSQGKLDGKVNAFQVQMSRSLQGDFWQDICCPYFYVTSAKKDIQSGDTKVYEKGVLLFDGDMKAFYPNGTGTSYYSNGKKQYVGQWLHGEYNGSGKLYDEDGKLIYSGKWKNGDYAS